jgi:hypothetical protein
VFGVRTKAAITGRDTKLGGNRGVKPIVKMRVQSAAGHQQGASARAAVVVVWIDWGEGRPRRLTDKVGPVGRVQRRRGAEPAR